MKRLFCLFAAASLAIGQDKAVSPAPLAATSNTMNVDLTVYVISGLSGDKPGVLPQLPQSLKDEVPQDLAGTLQQLRNVFTYKSYRLLDAFELRGRNFGGAEVGGELPYFVGGQYDFKYRQARVSPDSRVVHIDGLRLEITRRQGIAATGAAPMVVALVSTDLDVAEGQKTVVGKSAVNGSDALFLVVVPKIIE